LPAASYGKSSQPTIGFDYDTFASDLHRLLETLDCAASLWPVVRWAPVR
jgi:hypothetical protein